LKLPFTIVCECTALSDKKAVKPKKLGQLRSSGPRHEIAGESLYMVVIGRPKFSQLTIRNAEPNVCLLLAEDLSRLVTIHELQKFSNEELEKIFVSIGDASKDVNKIIIPHRRKLQKSGIIYALLCLCLADPSSSKPVVMIRNDLVNNVQAFGKALGLGIFTKDEILRGVTVLSSPVLNLIESNYDEFKLRGISLEEVLLGLGSIGKYILENIMRLDLHMKKRYKER